MGGLKATYMSKLGRAGYILHKLAERSTKALDSINVVSIVRAGSVRVNVVELDVVVEISANKVDCLVDLDGLWELAVRLQVARLVRRVLEDHVSLRVLR